MSPRRAPGNATSGTPIAGATIGAALIAASRSAVMADTRTRLPCLPVRRSLAARGGPAPDRTGARGRRPRRTLLVAGGCSLALACPDDHRAIIACGQRVARRRAGSVHAADCDQSRSRAFFCEYARPWPGTVDIPVRAHRARGLAPDLKGYTRCLTWIWVGFFLTMAAVSVVLAVTGPRIAWAWFTAAGNYLCVGLLFVGEYVYRRVRFSHYEHASPLRLLGIVRRAIRESR